MKKFLILAMAILAVSSANAADIYVSASADSNGDGSKASPYKSLSVAINAAQDNDVILVTEGKYLPDLLDDSRKSTFKIENKIVTIKGGYSSDFSNVIGKSLLTGDINGDDVYDESTGLIMSNYEDNCTRVITVAKNANVVLENLILQGGYADLTADKLDTGGAMYIGSPVKMENCVVTGNYCKNSAGGGGICVKGDLDMNNCYLYGNHGSGDGGAIYIKGDINVSITNCVFDTNKSTSGSAIFFNNALSCYIASNSFEGNKSVNYGTMTFYNKSFVGTISIINNTIANNTTSGNTNGKELLGGAGVYMYVAKTGKINIINNTMIGNYVAGIDATENPSPQLGGAFYVRQGTAVIANNVIAGNTSLSGYGDLYKCDAGVINSKEYNFYTSYDNMNVTPERNDIVAGLDRASGMAKMPYVFASELSNGSIIAKCLYNGGYSNTVKVIGADIDFDGLCIKSVPVDNLSEASLDTDLNNDGKKDGYLQYDQRGAKRNQSGQAYIGAYEYDGVVSGINTVVGDGVLTPYIQGGNIIISSDRLSSYSIYSVSGQLVESGSAVGMIDMSSLNQGLYIVRIVAGSTVQSLKVAIR